MTMPGRLSEPCAQGSGANLADILERVLDKGIVIAGDIRINALDTINRCLTVRSSEGGRPPVVLPRPP